MSDVPFNTQNVYGRNQAADVDATTGGNTSANKLWLPIWSGEVIRAYDSYRVFEPMVESRTISSGRQMEFPITGTAAIKAQWGAGEELVGSVDAHKSQTMRVTLDARPIASHFELDNIDLMISQWEFRSELARQTGQALANARDLQVGAYLVKAATEEHMTGDPRLAAAFGESKWRTGLANSPLFHVGSAVTAENIVQNSELDHIGSGTPP